MKTKIMIAVVLLLGIGLGLGGAQLLNGTSNASKPCDGVTGASSYSMMIMDNKVEPGLVNAKLCDTLTITNMDNVEREIAFGPHDDHVPYDGVGEKVLAKDQSLTITLNQAGSFHWHDHIHDDAEGYFNVTK